MSKRKLKTLHGRFLFVIEISSISVLLGNIIEIRLLIQDVIARKRTSYFNKLEKTSPNIEKNLVSKVDQIGTYDVFWQKTGGLMIAEDIPNNRIQIQDYEMIDHGVAILINKDKFTNLNI